MNRPNFAAFCFIVAVCLCSGPGTAQAGEGERWTLLGFTKYRDAVFIDKNSTDASSGRIKSLAKIAPSEKSAYGREVRRDLKRSGKNATAFKYVEIQSETDCRDGRMRFLQIRYFTRDGKVLHSVSYPDPKWKDVQSGTLWDKLRKAVCG